MKELPFYQSIPHQENIKHQKYKSRFDRQYLYSEWLTLNYEIVV